MLALRIFFVPRLKKQRIDASLLEKYLQLIDGKKLPSFPRIDGEVHLIFLGNRGIQKLNRIHRKKDRPTDVLSFSLNVEGEPQKPGFLFGEIYISLPIAALQARKHAHALQKELNILFVHGALHLLGYDHENDSDFKRMHTLEEEILNGK